MNIRGEDIFADCDQYLAWAAEETNYEKQMSYLQNAINADPKRIEDVLLIAKASQNISARSPGQKFIKELEKRIQRKKKKDKRKK